MTAGQLTFDAPDPSATARLGRALAQVLFPGAVVGLVGPLGAGKTHLVRAVAIAAGVDPRDVSSPTFVLVHEYRTHWLQQAWQIYHLDAYRIASQREFLELGVDEIFAAPGWTFVEWADRVTPCLPDDRLTIAIEPLGPEARRFRIAAGDGQSAAALKKLAELLAPPGAGQRPGFNA